MAVARMSGEFGIRQFKREMPPPAEVRWFAVLPPEQKWVKYTIELFHGRRKGAVFNQAVVEIVL